MAAVSRGRKNALVSKLRLEAALNLLLFKGRRVEKGGG